MERHLLSARLLLTCLLTGLVAGSFWRILPPTVLVWVLLVVALLLLLLYIRSAHEYVAQGSLCLACVLLGLAWSTQQGLSMQEARLPEAYAGMDWRVEGVVTGMPERVEQGERFDFQVERVEQGPVDTWSPGRLRLTHYVQRGSASGVSDFRYRPGDRWLLQVRLKPPRGLVNPYGFDFEGWLLAQGYSATGYVREEPAPRFVSGVPYTFQRAAFQFLQWTEQRVAPEHRALFGALAVGYGKGFTRQQWDLLRDTGTIHLVVVSGMHISLLALAGYGLCAAMARLCFVPLSVLPAPLWGALGAAGFASAYAWLSGFTVPVQRAWIMVLCGLAVWCLHRQVSVLTGFLLACVVVLLLEPLALYSTSFWLSFGAVAVLLGVFAYREYFPEPGGRLRRLLHLWIYTQFVLTLGMIPLLAFWIGSVPAIGFIANLLAVPWLTAVVFPLAIFSWAVDSFCPSAGSALLATTQACMTLFWKLLSVLQKWNITFYFLSADYHAMAGVVLALCGMAFLLFVPASCSRWSYRWAVGLCCLAALFFPMQEKIPDGEFRLTMLDVGQGLAVLVETRHTVLVYDTGEKFSDQFDIGRDLIAAHLRRRGYDHMDTLVISHGDSDHAGGSVGLLSALPSQRLLSGEPERVSVMTAHAFQPCLRHQHWVRDGVHFHILSPDAQTAVRKGNDRSCVLRVFNARESVLLTGDIQARQEAYLVAGTSAAELSSSVLLVPHHGSKTSSTQALLQAVQPRHALASVGYRSRYGHPHAQVVDRYEQQGIRLLRSDRSGAVVLESTDSFQRINECRRQSRYYWHHPAGIVDRRDLL